MWKSPKATTGRGLSKAGRGIYPQSPQGSRASERNRPGGPRRARVEATRAGDLIRQVKKDHGLDAQGKLDALQNVWRTLVGSATAGKTRIVGLKGGVLTVEVANSALSQELSVYLKRDLLAQLRTESGIKITDLRCRVGGWSNS